MSLHPYSVIISMRHIVKIKIPVFRSFKAWNRPQCFDPCDLTDLADDLRSSSPSSLSVTLTFLAMAFPLMMVHTRILYSLLTSSLWNSVLQRPVLTTCSLPLGSLTDPGLCEEWQLNLGQYLQGLKAYPVTMAADLPGDDSVPVFAAKFECLDRAVGSWGQDFHCVDPWNL